MAVARATGTWPAQESEPRRPNAPPGGVGGSEGARHTWTLPPAAPGPACGAPCCPLPHPAPAPRSPALPGARGRFKDLPSTWWVCVSGARAPILEATRRQAQLDAQNKHQRGWLMQPPGAPLTQWSA